MGKFVLLKKTPFREIERTYGGVSTNSFFANIRRPYTGLTAPKKERHATITVITSDGKKLDMLDLHALDGTRRTSTYSNFILQGYNRVENEKIQVQETWGAEYLLTYGRKPLFMQFNGVLVTASNFPWESQFWFNYENLLRGTRLAEEGARIFIEADNMYASGYMVNAQAQREEQVQQRVQFSFTLFVTKVGYFDIHQAANAALNLSPGSTKKVKTKDYASTTNVGEYAQLTGSGGNTLARKAKSRQSAWRKKRKEIFEATVPNLRTNPHLEAEVSGVLPGNSVSDTYGDQMGFGFSGGESVPGKGMRDQKERGTYVDPFLNTRAGEEERLQTEELLSEMTLDNSITETRSMVGTERSKSEIAAGVYAVDELLLEETDPEGVETHTQRYARELSESGSSFLTQTESILNGEASPSSGMNSDKGRSLIRRSTDITNLAQAWEVRGSRARKNKGYRSPRSGLFYIA